MVFTLRPFGHTFALWQRSLDLVQFPYFRRRPLRLGGVVKKSSVSRSEIMGLYATLNASVCCPSCGNAISGGWQFYFGDVSQLPTYRLGDTISWGGSDRGDPSMRDVIAVAHFDAAGFCNACNTDDALADIHIVDHVIQSIAFRSNEPWLTNTLFVGAERTPF